MKNRHNGAGNKPARMVVGALIVKHVEGLSDEKTIQENPYMQYKDCRVDCYNHPLGRPPKDETTATEDKKRAISE